MNRFRHSPSVTRRNGGGERTRSSRTTASADRADSGGADETLSARG
jgi:hypothetical protein